MTLDVMVLLLITLDNFLAMWHVVVQGLKASSTTDQSKIQVPGLRKKSTFW